MLYKVSCQNYCVIPTQPSIFYNKTSDGDPYTALIGKQISIALFLKHTWPKKKYQKVKKKTLIFFVLKKLQLSATFKEDLMHIILGKTKKYYTKNKNKFILDPSSHGTWISANGRYFLFSKEKLNVNT